MRNEHHIALRALLCGFSALSVASTPLSENSVNVRNARELNNVDPVEYCGAFLKCGDVAKSGVNAAAYTDYVVAYNTRLDYEGGVEYCATRAPGGHMATIDGDDQLFYLHLLAQQNDLWAFRLAFSATLKNRRRTSTSFAR